MDIGVNSEYGKLNSVLVHVPTKQEFEFNNAHDVMFESKPNYTKLMDEVLEYISLLESLDITVYTDFGWPSRQFIAKYYPNIIYMKDLAIVTPSKILLANPYHRIRQGEEMYLRQVLVDHLGVDPNLIVEFDYHLKFEGADLLWLKPNVPLINYGYRTSYNAALAINEYLTTNYKEVKNATYIEGNKHHKIPQHIQGSKCIFSKDTIAIRQALDSETFSFKNVYKFDETEEIVNNYSLNVITINENEIVMPAGCPETKQAYESLGVKCHESPMQEITKGAGGFACMTLYLNRDKVW